MRNGTTPIQAASSKVSSSSPAGSRRATASGATRQCANSRLTHDCANTQGRLGSAHERWAVAPRIEPGVLKIELAGGNTVDVTLDQLDKLRVNPAGRPP